MNRLKTFERQTGFHLVITTQLNNSDNPSLTKPGGAVEVITSRVHLNGYQQTLSLDPAKLEKAVERARQMGITPPNQVHRTRDGYVLVDGLYRLRAAESLSLERVPTVVE